MEHEHPYQAGDPRDNQRHDQDESDHNGSFFFCHLLAGLPFGQLLREQRFVSHRDGDRDHADKSREQDDRSKPEPGGLLVHGRELLGAGSLELTGVINGKVNRHLDDPLIPSLISNDRNAERH